MSYKFKDVSGEMEIIKDNIVGLIYNINFNPKGDNSKGVVLCTTNKTQELNRFKCRSEIE